MQGPVCVVVAHADDEVLGCGATIMKLKREGHEVHILILADGVSSRGSASADLGKNIQKRNEQAASIVSLMKVDSLTQAAFPDNQMDTVALLDVTKEVERWINLHRPKTVITHHAGDLNVDHRLVHQAVLTACRPQKGHPVRIILSCEVPSSTEWSDPDSSSTFRPNWFVDVGEDWPTKMKAIALYETEMREWPHPRSAQGVTALAQWRGCCVGVEYAEAFMLVRNIL